MSTPPWKTLIESKLNSQWSPSASSMSKHRFIVTALPPTGTFTFGGGNSTEHHVKVVIYVSQTPGTPLLAGMNKHASVRSESRCL